MATATGDGLAPTLKVDAIITAPMATATAAVDTPSVVAGGDLLVTSPMSTATADAPTPSIVTQAIISGAIATATASALAPRLDATITAPIATAVADALGTVFNVTIEAPMARAMAQASPPIGPERAIVIGTLGTTSPTPERRALLGDIVHVFISPDGDMDCPTVGDWFAEDEAMGGFMAAGGTLPVSVVEAKPSIYRYGTMWRSYHMQTRTCIWAGRIKEPRNEQGQYTIEGMGWGQVYGDKKIEYLLYQNLGTDGWQVGMSEPWIKDDLGVGEPNFGSGDPNWDTMIQDHMIEFARTTKFDDQKANTGRSTYAIFYAPNLPPGETLTRLAFTLNADVDSEGYSPEGSSSFIGIDHPSRVLRTNISDDTWTAASGSGLTRAMGPTAPHLSVQVGYLNEETGAINNWGEVAHIHVEPRGFDSKWDIGLLDVYPISFGHTAFADGSGGRGAWAATPGARVSSALVADPQGSYTSLADGGEFPWAGPVTGDSPTRLGKVNIIMVQAQSGHASLDGLTFKFNDDLGTGVTIRLRDIRVNALAEGDNMTAGQLVKDIASRAGLPEDYVEGAGWNILPYKIEQGKVAEAWEYASMISNRRARIGDSGCRAIFEFGRYNEETWTVDDERQEMLPIALDRYDRVRVRYQLHSATTSVKVKADPDPLPWYNEYETIDLPTPLRSSDRAAVFAEDVLEELVEPRTGGTGRISDLVDEYGARRSAHLLRAGSLLRHSPTRSPRMRVSKVRHTYDDVEVTFPDQPIALEKLTARREQRIADGRKWHRD